MSCTIVCIQPSPSQAHCGACHITLSGVSAFDRHRRAGECLDPATIGFVRDHRGIWRYPAPDPTKRIIWPQRAENGSGVGRDTLGPEIGSQGRTQPSHPTCVDVTTFGKPPGSEWRCGAECPVIDGGGIGASIVVLDEPGGAA